MDMEKIRGADKLHWSERNEVAIKLGIIFSSLSPPLPVIC
jgi:hypothetical protein